jgi:O-succinylbenzoic acid--CoA ligase
MNTRGGLAKLKQCRNILIGGAQISKELEKELIKNKITVYQSYGMTETVSHIALKKTGYLQETHYKAIEGVSFKTLDDCLIIHYPKMSTTVIKTNDLVELKDAHHFKWIGRNDFVINSGGYKISPEIIEDKIQTILSNEILLTGINDSEFGEKVGLIIKGKKDSINIRKADLKSILHPYEIPKMVTFISSFERTSNGKLDRKKTASKIKKSAWQILL